MSSNDLPVLIKELKTTNQLMRQQLRGNTLWRNFLQGLFVGLGGTIGLAIVLTITGYLIHRLEVVPLIGQDIRQVQPLFNSKQTK